MMNCNLLIFQVFAGAFLKYYAISHQLGATILSLSICNLIISLSKIFIMTDIINNSQRTNANLVFVMLILSTKFYVCSILTITIINTVILNFLSCKERLEDQYAYNIAYKIGCVIGIYLFTSMILFFEDSFAFIRWIYICLITVLVCVKYLDKEVMPLDKLDENEVNKNKSHNLITLLENAHKYKDIISAYMVLAVIAAIQNNIVFFTGNPYKALIPFVALGVLSLRKTKLFHFSIFLSMLLSHSLINGLPLFILSYLYYKIAAEVKIFSKEKFGDVMVPHATSHLVCNTIMCIVHICIILYNLA